MNGCARMPSRSSSARDEMRVCRVPCAVRFKNPVYWLVIMVKLLPSSSSLVFLFYFLVTDRSDEHQVVAFVLKMKARRAGSSRDEQRSPHARRAAANKSRPWAQHKPVLVHRPVWCGAHAQASAACRGSR